MAKNRVTPEAGTLVEYHEHDYREPVQVYFLTGNTYTWHQSYQWNSDAYEAVKTLQAKNLKVKVFNCLMHKWIAIPR